ncbi:MAG: nuclear transport factor 2 family protein [Candidatus Zixiibacteriota bacterium]
MTAHAAVPQEAGLQIAKTEQAFAKMAQDSGMVPAFLKFLHDDAVVFRPEPLNGKRWYAERTASTAQLNWWPTYVEAASSGDLGFSTGPYEFRTENSDSVPVYHGHFISIWKRQANGEFKVMADLGNSYDNPDSMKASLTIGNQDPAENSQGNKNISSSPEMSLNEAEAAFSTVTSSEGPTAGYRKYFHDDVRVYRDGSFPFVGKKSAAQLYSDSTVVMSSVTAFSDVSQANDFGYSYGISRQWLKGNTIDSAMKSSFLRVWRRVDGEWKVILDISLPIQK